MAVFVKMPKLTSDMDHGEILAWHKTEGDMARKGEVLCHVQHNHAVAAVEAAADGAVLAIMVWPGPKVPVDMPIAILGEYGESIGPMMAEARQLLGNLMQADAVTGATEKFKAGLT